MSIIELKNYVRDVQDFPKPGVVFKDITPLLANRFAFEYAVNEYVRDLETFQFDCIVSPESRGFLFGAPVAYLTGAGFIPVRKKGKLPSATCKVTYNLEYGSDTIEMHIDAIRPGQRVVIIDDVLATGGTVKAITKLVEDVGGIVLAILCLVEIESLGGRKLLYNYNIGTFLKY